MESDVLTANQDHVCECSACFPKWEHCSLGGKFSDCLALVAGGVPIRRLNAATWMSSEAAPLAQRQAFAFYRLVVLRQETRMHLSPRQVGGAGKVNDGAERMLGVRLVRVCWSCCAVVAVGL